MTLTLEPSAKKRALGLIFFIMLMDVVGISILFPVSAFIVQRYSQDALMVSMVTMLYAAAQFVGAPILGQFGDRFGRRPVLLSSIFGSAVGYLIFGIGGALWVLFLARVIDGFTGGNMSTASAYIADVSAPEERAKNFTLIGLAWGVGLVLGPLLGSIFGQIDVVAPTFVAAALALLSLALGFFWLPESLPAEQRTRAPFRLNDLNPLVAIGGMAARPGLGWFLIVLCLFNFVFSGIGSIETLFMIQRFAAEPWQVGLRLTMIGVILIVMQATLIPWVLARYDERRAAVVALFLQATGVLLAFLNPFFILFYAITIITSIASGFIFPSLTTLTSNRVAAHEQGQLMGVTTALASLANIFGPLWAGLVYDHVMPGAPYWMGAILFAVAALILILPGRQTALSVNASKND
jgi:MFS transporter, DHA1 family, tetracycline resistance protein